MTEEIIDTYLKGIGETQTPKESKKVKQAKPKTHKRIKQDSRIADVEIIIISKGVNYRTTRTLDLNKKNKVEIHNKKYDIDQSAFFLCPSRFRKKEKYAIVFREDNAQPVYMAKEKEGVSASLLRIANDSGALQKGLSELFTTGLSFSSRKILFLFLVIGIGAVAALIFTGQLDLGALM